jgi:hypothetical protein
MEQQNFEQAVNIRLSSVFSAGFGFCLSHKHFHLDLLLSLLDARISEEALMVLSRL